MAGLKNQLLINYASIKKIVDQMEKCICKINLNSQNFTGFFCEIPLKKDNKKFYSLIQ